MLPVFISIAIIISVALLRERSRTLAAVLVTLPINIPLAMWIIAHGNGSSPKLVYDCLVLKIVDTFLLFVVYFI